MTIKNIAWAAGIYEGEGSCYNNKSSHQGSHLRVCIAQKDTWLLYELKRLFGGWVGKPDKHGVSRWVIYGARARGFIYTIFSFLSPRRRGQVRKAMGV